LGLPHSEAHGVEREKEASMLKRPEDEDQDEVMTDVREDSNEGSTDDEDED
jgi:hypothetical protein